MANPKPVRLLKPRSWHCALLAGLGLVALPVWPELPTPGLTIELSAGTTAEMAVKGEVKTTHPVPLSAGAIEAIFKRVTALKPEATDVRRVALRPASEPPPKTGAVVKAPFPVETAMAAPKVEVGPLQVLQHSPEGPVAVAPSLRVTFNQPMVPVGSVEELAKIPVPIRITPRPEGQWRWLGVSTATFTPTGVGTADRFAMASEFAVEVPAGTTSLMGGKLAKAVRWSFRTPSVHATMQAPQVDPRREDSWVGLTPVLLLHFDQNIDAAAVLPKLRLEGGGSQAGLRMATPDEISNDPVVKNIKLEREGPPSSGAALGVSQARWLAVIPSGPLAVDTEYKLIVPKGTRSTEGPLETEDDQDFSFHTYGPMRVLDRTRQPRPSEWWGIEFSNDLDLASFKPDAVIIEPQLAGRRIEASGSRLLIQGQSQAHTEYRVTLPAGLRDVYGQTLGRSQTISVKVGSSQASFRGPDGDFVVLDPSGPPELSCEVVNLKQLHVRAYRVSPSDWSRYKKLQNDSKEPMPGELVYVGDVPVALKPDETGQVKVDLTQALPKRFGHLLVRIEPEMATANWNYREWLGWVESTSLGLDAMVDANTMVAWVSRLQDGAPVEGAQVELFPGEPQSSGADGLARLPLLEARPETPGRRRKTGSKS